MKKTLIFIIIAFSSCIAQKYASNEYPSPFEIEKIDSVKGSKNDLFVKANEWVAKTFTSAKDVIQMHDKEAGKIIAKGIMVSDEQGGLYTATNYIRYTLSIDVKDGKYRVKISDFLLDERIAHGSKGQTTQTFNTRLDDSRPQVYPKVWDNIRGDCWRQAGALVSDLNKQIHSESENW